MNLKPIIYGLIALLSLIIFLILAKKYRLDNKQKLVFGLFTIFWLSIVLVRSYRKAFAMADPSFGGLGLNEIMAVSITSVYGLISIFIRLPIFFITDYFKTRKFFILLSIVAIALTSFLVYISPSYITMYASSLSIGIGASFIALFNVMFADSFNQKDAILSVSILSIAPLFAEFLAAPIQYYITTVDGVKVITNYKYLWLASVICAIISFLLMLFMKETRKITSNFSFKKVKEVIINKNFIFLCLLGIFISLIKFSTSGSNYVSLVSLEEIRMGTLGIAYCDVIFSFSQLIAGVLMGIYLNKKIGVKKTLILGFSCSLIFIVMPLITKNSTLLFTTYGLNGFGYGLTYNILIGLMMQPFAKNYREVTMGIYQTFFAIGIYYGDKIYAYLYNAFKGDNIYYIYQHVYLIIANCILFLMIFVIIFFRKRSHRFEKV